MTWKDFEELMELLGDLRSKMAILAQLFLGGVPVAPEVEFTLEQRKAIKDADKAWERFRQKARGALVD